MTRNCRIPCKEY